MSCRKQDHALLICLAGLFVAAVGFLLSVLGTIIAKLTSHYREQPIVQIRDAAVIASTHSRSKSLPPDSLPDKATPRSPSSKHRDRRDREKLLIHVGGKAHAEPEAGVKLPASPDLELSPDATHAQHVVHFLTPTAEMPIISISPPPTRLSLHSESSASTDNHTILSESAASTDASHPAAEAQRGRRLRFSKIVHLFSDKRGNSKPRRRESLPSMRSEAAREPSPIPPVPPLPPGLSPVPISPAEAPVAPTSPTSPPSKSNHTPSRRRSLLIRTASCPGLYHSRHGRSHSSHEPTPPVPQSPFNVQSPVRTKSPLRSPVRKSKAEKKEPVPRLRTHPYEAPYFIPPPDSADVEEPLLRHRPSRRRTTPPEGARSTDGKVL